MKKLTLICLAAIFSVSGPAAPSSALVSSTSRTSATASGGSFQPVLSPDGRYLAFVSGANNLVANDGLAPFLDVFLRDRLEGPVSLISVATNGGGDENSVGPSVSADGRYVAFQSAASNLAPNDGNGLSDIFLRDTLAGTTLLISRQRNGQTGRASSTPTLSPDGRWIVFESAATNLVAGDTNGVNDVFLFDRQSGTNARVSDVALPAGFRPGPSDSPSLTPDGRLVAYVMSISNSLGAPAIQHVLVRNMQDGTTAWASAGVGDLPGFAGVTQPVLCADGTVVYFRAFNGGTMTNLYRYVLATENTTLVSPGATSLSLPSPSANGRYVAYESNGVVRVWDGLTLGDIVASVNTSGDPVATTEGPSRPVLSADGTKVCFLSSAAGLTLDPGNGRTQLYQRDLGTGVTRLLSLDPTGVAAGDLASIVPAMSANGNIVAFESTAPTMVADDFNEAADVFVRDVTAGVTTLMSGRAPLRPSLTGIAHAFLFTNAISANGRYVLYVSADNGLFPGDTNGVNDLFVRDMLNGTVEAVSGNATGAFTNPFHCVEGSLSAGGRHVAFTVAAPGVPATTAVFWRDLDGGVTRTISEPADSGPWALSAGPVISADGRWVAFHTTKAAHHFQAGITDANGTSDVILHDTVAQTNLVISRHAVQSGSTANGPSLGAQFSPDGRWLAFINHDGSLYGQLLVRDLQQGTNFVVNVLLPRKTSSQPPCEGPFAFSSNSTHLALPYRDGTERGVFVYHLLAQTGSVVCVGCATPAISGDGRYVAVENSIYQVFLYDRQTGTSNNLNAPVGLSDPFNRSYYPVLGGDARHVVFLGRTIATDPLNQSPRLFHRDRKLSGITFPLTPGASPLNGPSFRPQLARDGRTLVFSSFANNVENGDYNDRQDVFVVRLAGEDADADGLDDEFELAYFNNLNRDGSGDLDGDGQSDRAEFLAGTDPTNQGSVLRASTVTSVTGFSATIVWTSVPGRQYEVQARSDVVGGVWTTLPGRVTATSTTSSLPDVRVPRPARQFYRVVVIPY